MQREPSACSTPRPGRRSVRSCTRSSRASSSPTASPSGSCGTAGSPRSSTSAPPSTCSPPRPARWAWPRSRRRSHSVARTFLVPRPRPRRDGPPRHRTPGGRTFDPHQGDLIVDEEALTYAVELFTGVVFAARSTRRLARPSPAARRQEPRPQLPPSGLEARRRPRRSRGSNVSRKARYGGQRERRSSTSASRIRCRRPRR